MSEMMLSILFGVNIKGTTILQPLPVSSMTSISSFIPSPLASSEYRYIKKRTYDLSFKAIGVVN